MDHTTPTKCNYRYTRGAHKNNTCDKPVKKPDNTTYDKCAHHSKSEREVHQCESYIRKNGSLVPCTTYTASESRRCKKHYGYVIKKRQIEAKKEKEYIDGGEQNIGTDNE